MCRAKAVILAFRALREAGQPATRADRSDAVSAAGKDFVRVGLMADVPNQFVIWGIEDVMQSDCQLYHTKAGAQMTAGDGDRIDGLGAQFVGNLLEVPRIDTS